MTILDTTLRLDGTRTSIVAALQAGWAAFRLRRDMRRDLVAVSRLPPRLIRDMGFDPERIYAALDGTSDAVGPAHRSTLLPKADRV